MSGWQQFYGTVGENGKKCPGCGWCAAGMAFLLYLYKNSHCQQIPMDLPANIWISRSNDSHISVWYFLDQNCCTCAMWSVSSMFNTSQAAAARCTVLSETNSRAIFSLGLHPYLQPEKSWAKTQWDWRQQINNSLCHAKQTVLAMMTSWEWSLKSLYLRIAF